MNTRDKAPATPELPILLSVTESAYLLGVSERTVKSLIARRELPVRYIGRRRLIVRAALEAYAGVQS